MELILEFGEWKPDLRTWQALNTWYETASSLTMWAGRDMVDNKAEKMA
jgi:hypothetical protein